MQDHQTYMHRCLELAKHGLGHAAPNPIVGAVVVWKNQVIGEGYHRQAGLPHAEVEAIQSVKDYSKLAESTLYVNLEPCNHTGKTPPCTDLILRHKIPNLVVAQTDPNPLVAGTGILRLRKKGVNVIEGILKKEAWELNKRFNCFHVNKRPFVLLKWAITRDGFIDQIRKPGEAANPAWITDEFCRSLVHKWRTEESSILVGTQTASLDNPRLNIRAWKGRAPLRLVLDRHKSLPAHLNVFDQTQETWVFTEHDIPSKRNLRYFRIQAGKNDLPQMMQILYEQNIQSIMVEGGAELLNSFIKDDLWDEARVFTGPISFNKGVSGPEFNFSPEEKIQTGNSLLEIFRKQKPDEPSMTKGKIL